MLILLNREDIKKNNQALNLNKLHNIINKFRSFKYEHEEYNILSWTTESEAYLTNYILDKLKNNIIIKMIMNKFKMI